jgi:hypothetical protein
VPALGRTAVAGLRGLRLTREFDAEHPTLCIEAVRGFVHLETLNICSTISAGTDLLQVMSLKAPEGHGYHCFAVLCQVGEPNAVTTSTSHSSLASAHPGLHQPNPSYFLPLPV